MSQVDFGQVMIKVTAWKFELPIYADVYNFICTVTHIIDNGEHNVIYTFKVKDQGNSKTCPFYTSDASDDHPL